MMKEEFDVELERRKGQILIAANMILEKYMYSNDVITRSYEVALSEMIGLTYSNIEKISEICFWLSDRPIAFEFYKSYIKLEPDDEYFFWKEGIEESRKCFLVYLITMDEAFLNNLLDTYFAEREKLGISKDEIIDVLTKVSKKLFDKIDEYKDDFLFTEDILFRIARLNYGAVYMYKEVIKKNLYTMWFTGYTYRRSNENIKRN